MPKPNNAEGAVLLDKAGRFIGKYLQCSEHQLAVMALWSLHTHCFEAARVTPYLSIQSTEKQSGKSLCLQLLSLLSDGSALTVGFTASSLTRRLDHDDTPTFLLDECQAILGARVRSKNPALRAILAAGYECGASYTDSTHERNTFGPKAFAGRGQLPEELADRSIPIVLSPLSGALADMPARFDAQQAAAEAVPLHRQLGEWAEKNMDALVTRPTYSHEDFPTLLTPRRRDLCEPLFQLADFIGGEWPARIRAAIDAIFDQELKYNLRPNLQLLAALHDCFKYNEYPQRLSSAVMLEWVQSLPDGSLDIEGALNGRTLARMLAIFGIRPRLQRNGFGSTTPARGYQLQDFRELWLLWLGFTVPAASSAAQQPEDSEDESMHEPATREAAVTDEHMSEIINRYAPCNTVTDDGAVSAPVPILRKPVASAKPLPEKATRRENSSEAFDREGVGITQYGSLSFMEQQR